MSDNSIVKKLSALASNARAAIVQDCPPELSACEVCGEFECSSEEWLHCSRRLEVAQRMNSAAGEALADAGPLRTAGERAPCCKVQAGDCAGGAESRGGETDSRIPIEPEKLV